MQSQDSLIADDRRAELEAQVREIMASRAALDALREEHLTFGEQAADRMATVAGSWTFIFAFLAVVALWVALNTFAWISHWDGYPFILLNLALSILAAVQAPVIMMSQNRDQAHDRLHNENDYRTNVRARSSWSTSPRRSRRSSSCSCRAARCRSDAAQGALSHVTISTTLNTYHDAISALQEEAAALIAGLVFADKCVVGQERLRLLMTASPSQSPTARFAGSGAGSSPVRSTKH